MNVDEPQSTYQIFRSTFWEEEPRKYKSMDSTCVNNQISIYYDEIFRSMDVHFHWLWFCRWVLIFLIAFLMAVMVFVLEESVIILVQQKLLFLEFIAQEFPHNIWFTYIGWISLNIIFMSIASGVCILFSKEASGGHIAAIIAYLNGIHIEHYLTGKVFLIKIVSTIAQTCTATFGGKEGPIIHCAVIIGNKLPELISKIKYFPTLHKLYSIEEKRNLSICATAGGVSAAFGAPWAGVFLALEETTSFFNLTLLPLIVFCSFSSNIFLKFISQAIFKTHHQSVNATYYKLSPTFGERSDTETQTVPGEIFLYILMGTMGGLIGSGFLVLARRMLIWRKKMALKTLIRFVETLVNASVIAIFHITFLYLSSRECIDMEDFVKNESTIFHKYTIPRIACPANTIPQISPFMSTFTDSLEFLMRTKPNILPLIFVIPIFSFFFIFGIITVGHCFSTGILTCHMILGASWGRMTGLVLFKMYGESGAWINVRKFAIFGAAAHVTAVIRLQIFTICLILEQTGSFRDYIFPLLLICLVSKFVSEIFSPSFYEIQLDLMQAPYLKPSPPNFGSTVKVKKFMSHKVKSLSKAGTVSEMINIVSHGKGNYPILNSKGKLLGDISACAIYKILLCQVYNEIQPLPENKYDPLFKILFLKDCSIHYIEKKSLLLKAKLTPKNLVKVIDLTPFINLGPFCVRAEASLCTIYFLLRQVGIRTVYIVNEEQILVGIVTREDIIKYKTHFYLGRQYYLKMKRKTTSENLNFQN